MQIGATLSLHIAGRLMRAIALAVIVFIVLMALVDFTQIARFVGDGGIPLGAAILGSAMRAPSLAETVLPFAVLFAAIATFVQLNRRSELTVVRAAGVSAWQILLPACAVAFLVGLFAIALYNPGAAALRDLSVSFGGAQRAVTLTSGGPVWIRQNGRDGPSIIGARRTADEGRQLEGVTAFVFNPDGSYRLRVDAPGAELVGRTWVFDAPEVNQLGEGPAYPDEFVLDTNLSLAQIAESLADPATVAFWRLPGLIEIATASALPATDLRMRLHGLIALPALLVVMVLIAATVSLRFSRTLNLGRLLVAGAASGFVFYVILAVSSDLGRGGLVAPIVAAWAPVLVAALLSLVVLLREEDG